MAGRRKNGQAKPANGVKHLFAQPPSNLYGKTSVYLCGGEMEIENFCELLLYQEGKIQLRLQRGLFTVEGDRLEIEVLDQKRIRLRGTILRTEFSYPENNGERGDAK